MLQPIAVATRSKAGTAFAWSNTEIVGSNLSGSMDVCISLYKEDTTWNRREVVM
jgi:hypothetical protein